MLFAGAPAPLERNLALFPEMWSVGYKPATAWDREFELWRGPARWPDAATGTPQQRRIDVWQGLAITRDDPFITHFQAGIARELKMAIAITYLEKWAGAPRNTVSVIDRYGETILTYAKVHTCD